MARFNKKKDRCEVCLHNLAQTSWVIADGTEHAICSFCFHLFTYTAPPERIMVAMKWPDAITGPDMIAYIKENDQLGKERKVVLPIRMEPFIEMANRWPLTKKTYELV